MEFDYVASVLYLVLWPWGMWDLNFVNRNWTHTPYIWRWSLNQGIVPHPSLSLPLTTSFFFYNIYLWVCFSLVIYKYIYIYMFIFVDSTYKWYHTLFVFFWLISLSIIFSRSIHVATNSIIPLFIWLNNIPMNVYMDHIFFIHLSVDEQIGCFCILATVNNIGLCALFK